MMTSLEDASMKEFLTVAPLNAQDVELMLLRLLNGLYVSLGMLLLARVIVDMVDTVELILNLSVILPNAQKTISGIWQVNRTTTG